MASYPSTVLMNVIPAQVAGVSEIAVTVPTPGGKINPEVMASLQMLGVDEVYCVGGAQAVASLAYGTESIRKVDKITGPGNIYVATAKKMVYGSVDIDMIAGPSEILIIADSSASPTIRNSGFSCELFRGKKLQGNH
jgi:histidinol dehydrogenase